jgi:hypothetical protein
LGDVARAAAIISLGGVAIGGGAVGVLESDVSKGSREHSLAGLDSPVDPIGTTTLEVKVVEPHEDGDADHGCAGKESKSKGSWVSTEGWLWRFKENVRVPP